MEWGIVMALQNMTDILDSCKKNCSKVKKEGLVTGNFKAGLYIQDLDVSYVTHISNSQCNSMFKKA
jgi:hypothetical protein